MEQVWADKVPCSLFLRKLKLDRARSLYSNVPFLRQLRHRWDVVTKLNKSLGHAVSELYSTTIFDLVIESETRPLTVSSISQILKNEFFRPVTKHEYHSPILFPDILDLISEFVGEPESDVESSEEEFQLPGDGSYPMVPLFSPMIKII
jgi:hypothetical protein